MWHCLLSGDPPCRQGTLYRDEQGQSGAQIWGWLSSVEHRVASRACQLWLCSLGHAPCRPCWEGWLLRYHEDSWIEKEQRANQARERSAGTDAAPFGCVFFKRLSRGCHAGSQHCLSPRWAAGADWDDAWLQHGFSWQTLLCARPCSPQPGHLPHLGLPPGHAVPVPFRVRG